MNKPYEGWTVSQAVAANILGVTKVGAGIWV